MLQDFEEALKELKANHTYRTMRCIDSPESSEVKLNGKSTLLLASNSYLDLADIWELKQAMVEAVLTWGTGSGGARLTTGNKTPHEELESELAYFKEEESALVFNTGYMANVGVISALCSKDSFVFSDELNHASIIDGIRLSKAKCYVYKHNNLDDLKQQIFKAKENFKIENSGSKFKGLIVTDAVFSMDGDLANLPELLKIAELENILLMIDEAHATGVLGHSGRGLAEHYNDLGIACKHAHITVGTLSKAIASEGGFVAASKSIIEFLKNKARSFIFTTAMSPAIAASALANLKFIENNPQRILQLKNNVDFFCQELNRLGFNIPKTYSAIVPIIIGDEEAALNISAKLQEKGILIPAIRYPTVAKGAARLRASLMATHKKEDLKKAAEEIASLVKQK